MKNSLIQVIIKKPNEDAKIVCDFENTLENLQETVGGYIEVVPLIRGKEKWLVILNEEGKFKDLKPNIMWYSDVIMGDIIVVRADGEEFGSLDNEDLSYIINHLETYSM